MALVDDLIAQFGLTTPQAEGALGAIGRAAQGKLAPEHLAEFGRLIPGLERMIGAAPKAGGLSSLFGGSLGEAAQLASVFNTLGIGNQQIMPIAKAVLAFLRANGSEAFVAALAPWTAKLGLG